MESLGTGKESIITDFFPHGEEELTEFWWPASFSEHFPGDCFFELPFLEDNPEINKYIPQSSTPSSSYSDTLSSGTCPSGTPESETRDNSSPTSTFQLSWPAEGQLQAHVRHSSDVVSPIISDDSFLSQKISSPRGSVSSGPHHEGTCAKCHLTEAEAKKCKVERRREQNRASQRKFRARKEAKIKQAASQVASLESHLEFLEKHNGDLKAANATLRRRLTDLEVDRVNSPSSASKGLRNISPTTLVEMNNRSTPSRSRSLQEPSSDPHLSLIDLDLDPPFRSFTHE